MNDLIKKITETNNLNRTVKERLPFWVIYTNQPLDINDPAIERRLVINGFD